MTKTIEVSGRTEEEAIAAGLEQLGKTRDEVSVEVVERSKKGVLGICRGMQTLAMALDGRVHPVCFFSQLYFCSYYPVLVTH